MLGAVTHVGLTGPAVSVPSMGMVKRIRRARKAAGGAYADALVQEYLINPWLNRVGVGVSAVDVDAWVRVFEAVCYSHNGVVDEKQRPREALTLFRGARDEDCYGLSWTDSLEFAEWFAERADDGRVWSVVVPSDRLLAWIGGQFGDSQVAGGEFVADVRGLSVEVVR